MISQLRDSIEGTNEDTAYVKVTFLLKAVINIHSFF